MAMMAGVMGDKKGLSYYLSKTSNQWNHFAQSVWRKKATLQQFMQWASDDSHWQVSNRVSKVISNTVNQAMTLLSKENRETLALYGYTEGDLNRRDVYGDTLLHRAVAMNNQPLVSKLLQLGANASLYDSHGKNALHIAASFNQHQMVNLLVNAGVDLQAQSSAGKTVLHIAAQKGFMSLVEQLISLSPKLLNLPSRSKAVALHHATSKGHVELVAYLLSLPRIKADLQDGQGYSALHYAVSNNYLTLVKMLVEYGVDTALLTQKYHYTALNLAKENAYHDIEQYLMSVGAGENKNIVTYTNMQLARERYEEAGAYYNQQQFSKGIVLLEQALELNPSYALAQHGLAVLYLYYAKDYKKAEAAIVASLALSTNDIEAYYTAGRVYYALDQIDRSKPYFQEYVTLAPDTYNAQDLKKIIGIY